LFEVKANLEEAKHAVTTAQHRLKSSKELMNKAEDLTENESAYMENIIAKHSLAEANAKLIKS